MEKEEGRGKGGVRGKREEGRRHNHIAIDNRMQNVTTQVIVTSHTIITLLHEWRIEDLILMLIGIDLLVAIKFAIELLCLSYPWIM